MINTKQSRVLTWEKKKMLKMQATMLLYLTMFPGLSKTNHVNSPDKKDLKQKKKGLNQINNKSNSIVLNYHLESCCPNLS